MIEKTMLGLDRALTQQVELQRDHATSDKFGARATPDWRALPTVACFMWWGSGKSIARMGSVQVRPEGTVDIDVGGMVLPEGTDVSARDRIGRVLDEDGNVIEAGPLQILACAAFEGMTELSFRRVS